MLTKFSQDSVDLPDKDASIPYIVPISEIVLRSVQIRFFNKTLGEKGTMSMSFVHFVGETDIAITCFWCGWLNAYRDEISFFRQLICQVKGLSKCLDFSDHVVSAEDRHNAFWIFTRDSRSSPGDSRCRV